jgi:hypothetical protein
MDGCPAAYAGARRVGSANSPSLIALNRATIDVIAASIASQML